MMLDFGIRTAATTLWRGHLGPLSGIIPQSHYQPDDELFKDPKRLASIVGPICSQMLAQLNYAGAPRFEDEEPIKALVNCMYKKAVEIDLPLDTPLSSKGFRLGVSLALLSYPNHPVETQAYIGIFSWLVVQYDDIVGQNDQMVDEALLFHERLFRGERQPNNILEGLAGLLRESYDHFDRILANMLQISLLLFLTSNLLERHTGFQKMPITRAGKDFPDFYRDMSGISVGYAVFSFPKKLYPDVEVFLEAILDMAKFINIANDVLSFYKEEVEGEKRNYIHNRAKTTGNSVFVVLEEVKRETVECVERANTILRGKERYAQSCNDCVRGMAAMHTTNARYKMEDLGLGEEHPLTPIQHKLNGLPEAILT